MNHDLISRSELLRVIRLLDTPVIRSSKEASYLLDQVLFDIGNFNQADYENRCETCESFDTTGYDDTVLGAGLQIGFCTSWRRDTQACDFCSKYTKKKEANNGL